MRLLKNLFQLGLMAIAAFILSGCLAGPNTVELQSDAGDYIGQGQHYKYTQADAVLAVSASGNRLSIQVSGDQKWDATFQAPSSFSRLEVGKYENLQRFPFNDATKGGLHWGGEGRGCNTLQGWFAIDKVTYSGGTLTAIDLRFEQHCEGGASALHGEIHWDSTDKTLPPGPVNPPPADLWQPAAGSTPASGNFVHLQSESGDYIGGGQTKTYTSSNAIFSASANGGLLTVNVNGNESWTGNFLVMNTLTSLQSGYYPGLKRYPFSNPIKGGLDWSGESRGCNTLNGWFAIDNIRYENGVLKAIDLRFEQHCEGKTPALRGKIHWDASNTATPPGPVNPPPAGLWQPTSGTTPASGNFAFLQSESGDYIGQGKTSTYTPANATISVNANAGYLSVSVVPTGSSRWLGDFQAMTSLSSLQPGYYANLERYPFHNPIAGGLNWSGQGRGCNTLRGWFVVDSVNYVGGVLTAIDLRFEQHCEGQLPALYGKIHWSS